MLEPEMAALLEVLLGLVTNSEIQAAKWAREIIEKLEAKGFKVEAVTSDPF